jgi:TfoX/Sxy family transcriptional regulator of competence genes
MAYDKELAQRVREIVAAHPGLVEKAMFGGLGFMLQGNMCCGVLNDELVVRVGPEQDAAAAERPGAQPFDFTGRPMQGWLFVSAEGYDADDALESWVNQGIDYALSLPPK